MTSCRVYFALWDDVVCVFRTRSRILFFWFRAFCFFVSCLRSFCFIFSRIFIHLVPTCTTLVAPFSTAFGVGTVRRTDAGTACGGVAREVASGDGDRRDGSLRAFPGGDDIGCVCHGLSAQVRFRVFFIGYL